MVQVNFSLLVAIRAQGLKQMEFAKIVGQDPSVVSRVISGVYNLNEEWEERYAKALNMKREDLFNSNNPN